MNKNIIIMYKCILKEGWIAKVERIKDGIYGIGLYKKGPLDKIPNMQRFFYLYPRNIYTGKFVDE